MTQRIEREIVLIDSTPDSLTVSWPEATSPSPSTRYVLQYRTASAEAAFETLSDKLSSTQAKKKNLCDGDSAGFFFRVTSRNEKDDWQENDETKWITHSQPFLLLSESEEKQRMLAPVVVLAGTNLAARIFWKSTDGAKSSYELQMRENCGGCPWNTIAPSISGTEVKKKNMTSKYGYQFRMRPSDPSVSHVPFSPPSEPFVALGLSEGLKRVFSVLEDGALLPKAGQTPIKLEEALGGKEFILLYASAHWCGPCRQFSPQLVSWYNSLGPNRTIELVFLSADHDENSFNSYYSSMPWMAVPFDDDGREALMGYLRVQGIPRLAVLDGRTGRIIEDNAVGKPLDMNRWRKLIAS